MEIFLVQYRHNNGFKLQTCTDSYLRLSTPLPPPAGHSS